MTRLYVVPMELAEANAFVRALHRHHDALPTHRFSIGAITNDGVVHGVAICSRPVARALSSRDVLEVSRLCTDGTPNACSALYGAAARAARAMGYRRVQTYILDNEPGTSLIAAGWRCDGYTSTSHTWNNRPGRNEPTHLLNGRRGRWVKDLGDRPAMVEVVEAARYDTAPTLFDGGAA
jgi:hypothetical protein